MTSPASVSFPTDLPSGVPVVPGLERLPAAEGAVSYRMNLVDRHLGTDVARSGTLLYPLGAAPECSEAFPRVDRWQGISEAWKDEAQRNHPARQRLLYEVTLALQEGVFYNREMEAHMRLVMAEFLPGDLGTRRHEHDNVEGGPFTTEVYFARLHAGDLEARLRETVALRTLDEAGELQAGVNLGTLRINHKTRRRCTAVAVSADRRALTVQFKAGSTVYTCILSPLRVLQCRRDQQHSDTLKKDVSAAFQVDDRAGDAGRA